MASSIQSFRVEAAFSGTCKTNVTEKVRDTQLEINRESGRPLQAGARVGSALYRSLKSVATSMCRAPMVFYILLVETTRNSNGKMFAYQVNIELLTKSEQPSGLAFAGTYRTSTRKFSIDTILGWNTCSLAKNKPHPRKFNKSASGTAESTDESIEVDINGKHHASKRRKALPKTVKRSTRSRASKKSAASK
jgi:hypothetical protein